MRGGSLRIQRALGIAVLEDRLDHHVRVGNAVACHIGHQPSWRPARAPADRGCAWRKQFRRALQRRRDLLQRAILQRDVEPCAAHQAAMSPPMMPAPTTCTLRRLRTAGGSAVLAQPSALSRSCSWNTRTRLRAVGALEQLRDGLRLGVVGRAAARAMSAPTGRRWRRAQGSARGARAPPPGAAAPASRSPRTPARTSTRSSSGGRCAGG